MWFATYYNEFSLESPQRRILPFVIFFAVPERVLHAAGEIEES